MEVVFSNPECQVVCYSGVIDALGPFDVPVQSNQQKIARKYKYIRFAEGDRLHTISDVIVHHNCDPDVLPGKACELYVYEHLSDDPILTILAVSADGRSSNDLPTFLHSQSIVFGLVRNISRNHRRTGWAIIGMGIVATATVIAAIAGIPMIFFGWWIYLRNANKAQRMMEARSSAFPTTQTFEQILKSRMQSLIQPRIGQQVSLG